MLVFIIWFSKHCHYSIRWVEIVVPSFVTKQNVVVCEFRHTSLSHSNSIIVSKFTSHWKYRLVSIILQQIPGTTSTVRFSKLTIVWNKYGRHIFLPGWDHMRLIVFEKKLPFSHQKTPSFTTNHLNTAELEVYPVSGHSISFYRAVWILTRRSVIPLTATVNKVRMAISQLNHHSRLPCQRVNRRVYGLYFV